MDTMAECIAESPPIDLFDETPSSFLAELFDGVLGDAKFLARLADVSDVPGPLSVKEQLLRVSESLTSISELGLEFLQREISEG